MKIQREIKLILLLVLGIVILYMGFLQFIYAPFILRKNINYYEVGVILQKPDYKFNYFNEWKVKSIKKYDDNFTSPHVEIKYSNKVKLSIYQSNEVSILEFDKLDEVVINNLNIKRYERNNDIFYKFKLDELWHMLKFTLRQEQDVKNNVEKIS